MEISSQIEKFRSFQLPRKDLSLSGIDDHGWLISPKSVPDLSNLGPNKEIGLTLMAITHGNEFGGVAVLNQVMDWIRSDLVQIHFPVAFLLGNPWAATMNKRFVENDLNRSFDVANPTRKEELRARELQGILQKTGRLLDFHQTAKPSDRPFFIFPYSQSAFGFARHIMPRQTIVSHWGKPFSTEGRCTDEYVNTQGGVGITMELGQNGFDQYQVAVGVQAAINAISEVHRIVGGADGLDDLFADEMGPVMTWSAVVPWPEEGTVYLREGLDNFMMIEEGEQLGRVDDRPLLAPAGGRIIFPKYLTPEQQAAQSTRPTELLRLMKEVSAADLPK